MAKGLEAAQQYQNKILRDLVDASRMSAQGDMKLQPWKVWNTHVQGQMATTMNTELEKQTIESVVRGFLPHVCNKHVYEFKVNVQTNLAEDRHVAYAKWTFFNDQDVRLKAYVARAVEDPIDPDRMTAIRLRTTTECDLEEWQADAIMRCEAGEEVWERPKPNAFAGVSQAASAQQASLAQQALQQGQQSQQGALSSGLNALAGGLLSGGMFK
jgi:hypothetical protein